MSENVTRGIRVQVLRPADGVQSTLGPSSRSDRLTVIGVFVDDARFVTPMPADCGVVMPDEASPAVAVQVRTIGGSKIASIVPVEADGEGFRPILGTMASGNFAHSSDSRLRRLLEKALGSSWYGALSVHDRAEAGGAVVAI